MKKIGFLFTSLTLLGFFSCNIAFVKMDEIKKLDKKYEGVYIVKKDIEIGVNEYLKAGTKVRLYFISGKKLIKVYAYPADKKRESAFGKNIILMFETEFEEKQFKEELLDNKIQELLKKEE